jgi:hypothetical protein
LQKDEKPTHQIAVASASACDIAVHGAGDRVVLGKVGVGDRFGRGKTTGILARDCSGTLGAQAAPGFDLMPVGEHGILPFVLAAVDWKSLSRFPAPDGAFAALQVGRDLLPRLQSFRWGVPL